MRFRSILAATAIALSSSVAMAAPVSFDFGTDAQSFFDVVTPGVGKYEGTFDQVYGIVPTAGRSTTAGTAGANIVGAINLTASAVNAIGAADPFMDSEDDGRPAGLGVCSSGVSMTGISNCSSAQGNASTGDDNLVSPEILTLSFGTTVALRGLEIRDRNHFLIANVADALKINGMTYGTDGAGMVQGLETIASGSVFTFTSDGQTIGGDELYLSVLTVEAVPVPAGILLMGTALAGFGVMRRRKKTA